MVSMVDRHAERSLPELPSETWVAAAAAALHADDDDVRTWARLSLVNKTWHAALAGVAWLELCKPWLGRAHLYIIVCSSTEGMLAG